MNEYINSHENASVLPWYYDDLQADEFITDTLNNHQLSLDEVESRIAEVEEALNRNDGPGDLLARELRRATASNILFQLKEYQQERKKGIINLGNTPH